MDTSAGTPNRLRIRQSLRILRPVAWLGALAITGYFLHGVWHDYSVSDTAAYGIHASRRAWLWLHLGAGAAMLVLGP